MIIRYNFYKDDNFYANCFDYEVDNDQLKQALKSIFYKHIIKNISKEYSISANEKLIKDIVLYIIEELDIIDNLAYCYMEDIENYFYYDAYNKYNNIS